MKNKKILLAVLALALVFGMTVIGCDNGTTENNPFDGRILKFGDD